MTEPSPPMQALVESNIRLAATVMLLRDSEAGLEVYMVQRPGKGDFPDLHVFPGGKVDADDYAPENCFGLPDAKASERLGVAAGGHRYWNAVARECFEECGVLLARKGGVPFVFDREAGKRFFDHRERLLANEATFTEICRLENLQVDCERLEYFSHWITPKVVPRRFDTRFFIAAMPDDQSTYAYSFETVDDAWVRPKLALANNDAGVWQMIDPTLRSLKTLAQYKSVNEALVGVRRGRHLMPLTALLSSQGMQKLR